MSVYAHLFIAILRIDDSVHLNYAEECQLAELVACSERVHTAHTRMQRAKYKIQLIRGKGFATRQVLNQFHKMQTIAKALEILNRDEKINESPK